MYDRKMVYSNTCNYYNLIKPKENARQLCSASNIYQNMHYSKVKNSKVCTAVGSMLLPSRPAQRPSARAKL